MWYFRLGPDDNDESWLEVNGEGRCRICGREAFHVHLLDAECVPVREPVSR